ncbi:MAG: hypothetical protein IJB16_09255 [Clostridia bacterium]|nr:hypothetical protein [Clostridia bacterium]
MSDITEIELCFASENDKSSILIDRIEFSPSDKDLGIGFEADADAAENLFDYVSALFVNFIGMIVSIFR